MAKLFPLQLEWMRVNTKGLIDVRKPQAYNEALTNIMFSPTDCKENKI
jgi:hypothetical protein